MLSVTDRGVIHIPPNPTISPAQALAALATLAADSAQHPPDHPLPQALALVERYIRQQAPG